MIVVKTDSIALLAPFDKNIFPGSMYQYVNKKGGTFKLDQYESKIIFSSSYPDVHSHAGWPSRFSRNSATSLRKPKAPWDPVYAPVPESPRISRIFLALSTTSTGNIVLTSG